MKTLFTIRNKLLASFALILLVPVIITGQFSYQTAENKVSEQMAQSSQESIKLLNQLLTATLSTTMNNVDNLSENMNASLYQGMESPLVRTYLDPFHNTHPDLVLTYLGTESGLTFIAPYEKVSDDYDPRSRPWYQEAMKRKGQVYITDPYPQLNNQTNQPTGVVNFSVVKTVKDGSGVIGVDLNLSKIAESVKEVKIGKEGYAFLLDRDGKVLVHPTAEIGTQWTDGWVQQVLGSEQGQFTYVEQGKEKRLAFVTNPLTGWKLVGTMYQEEVAKEASSIYETTLTVIAISVVLGGVLVFLIVRSITKPLSRLVTAAEKIGQGDFTQQLSITSLDEMGKLASTFNRMSEVLRGVVHDIGEKAELLAASSEELTASTELTSQASNQIANAMQEVAIGTERQLSGVEVSSRAIGEMSEGMKKIAHNAEDVNHTAIKAAEKSSQGGKTIQTATEQMKHIHSRVHGLSEVVEELGSRSLEIGKIIDVITGIAAQTNLLALNAAIEAARAGDHGRGFAVVADEVRKLAEQSAGSAQQIAQLVSMIQEKTGQAVGAMETVTKEVTYGIDAVNSAGESFVQIQQSVGEVSGQIEEVSSAIQLMSTGAQQVVDSIGVISKVVEETSSGTQSVSAATEEQLASMQEITASAYSLSKMSEELQKLIGKFKV